MRVWIDQDQCTGDGLCEEVCAATFTLGDAGLAFVREDAKHFGEDRSFEDAGEAGQARVPGGWEDAAIEAAETCPGECIFIEAD